MTTGSASWRKRTLSVLAVAAVLAMMVAQVMAALPSHRSSASRSRDGHLLALCLQSAPACHPGTPSGPCSCCVIGSIAPTVPPLAGRVPLPALPHMVAYRLLPATSPEGLVTHPAVPPPRAAA